MEIDIIQIYSIVFNGYQITGGKLKAIYNSTDAWAQFEISQFLVWSIPGYYYSRTITNKLVAREAFG